MPAAIDLFVCVEVTPRADAILSVTSDNFGESVDFDLDQPVFRHSRHWTDYVCGVAMTLKNAGCLVRGANLRIRSDIPIGAGLSSSAALEVATAHALLQSWGIVMQPIEVARLCQRAEHEFAGVKCGIMDQFATCFGRAGNALLLDCRSLTYRLLSIPDTTRLVIANTLVKHDLAQDAYNERRSECEQGALLLNKPLRDASLEDLQEHRHKLPEVIYRRCRHVITENDRVVEAGRALEKGDLDRFGELMNASHRSLRDDYQVSCEELDLLVNLARELPGVYGSRLTGGGFGGCTISLVQAEYVEGFKRHVIDGYRNAVGKAPDIYVCKAADGAREIIEV
jgi:galactokinase